MVLHKPPSAIGTGGGHVNLSEITLLLQAKAIRVLGFIFETTGRLGQALEDPLFLEEGIGAAIRDVATLILLLSHEESTKAVGVDAAKSTAEIRFCNPRLGDEVLDFLDDLGARVVNGGGTHILDGVNLDHESKSIRLIQLLGLLAGSPFHIGHSLALLAFVSLLFLLLLILGLGKETGSGPVSLVLCGLPLVLVRSGLLWKRICTKTIAARAC